MPSKDLRNSLNPQQSKQRLNRMTLWYLGIVAGAMTVALWGSAATAQTTRLPARDPDQVPTARYGRGEAVDLSLIVEEWRDRFPAIPVYTCSCNADICGDDSIWPSRTFTRYQPFLALGDFNAINNEETGFNCFDIETGARPRLVSRAKPHPRAAIMG